MVIFRRFVVLPALFAMLFGALLLGCEPDQAVPIEEIEAPVAYINHPDPGQSASRSERELMLLDAATGETWQLTNDWANDRLPVWSPSGTHLMFVSGRGVEQKSLPPWPVGTGVDRLFIYDLKAGSIEHVDLSWARESGPAAPEVPEDDMRTLGWLECGAWSPVDTTKVAVGVTVGWKGNMESARRLVLLDLEAQEARLLAEYTRLCGALSWSPDGRFLLTGVGSFDILDVENGKKYVLKENADVTDSNMNYSPVEWSPEGMLLVKEYSIEADTSTVYMYDAREGEFSDEMGGFPEKIRGIHYAPTRRRKSGRRKLDLITLRELETSFYTDLWLQQRPDGSEKRLTDDRMPKRDVTSYHETTSSGEVEAPER